MKLIKRSASGVLDIIYPNVCLACEQAPPIPEDIFCVSCHYHLPKTDLHLYPNNVFVSRFRGRVRIEAGAALLYFSKESRVQKLIYNLKYQNKTEIGRLFGLYYGRLLKQASCFRGIDAIIPVPLHAKKKHKRGFNQSEVFARGLAEVMQTALFLNVLIRKTPTSTQTKMDRLSRLKNMINAFEVINQRRVNGKHILLVDDVLTTGATLEACSLKLLEKADVKISLLTLAMATN